MSVEAIDTRYDMYERRPGLSGLLPGLPPIGRLGVAILAIGWVVLLMEPVVTGLVPPALQGIVSRIGQSAIMTGAGLAVLGLLMTMAVQKGEGSARSRRAPPADAERLVAPVPVAVPAGVVAAVAPPPAAPTFATASPAAHFAQAAPAVVAPPVPTLSVEPQFEQPLPRAVEPAAAFVKTSPDSRAKASTSVTLPISGSMVVVARGQVDDRCFLILSDGSMVIETLLGQRRFRSLDDARDFIGGGNFLLHDTVNIPLKPAGAGEAAPKAASRVLRHV